MIVCKHCNTINKTVPHALSHVLPCTPHTRANETFTYIQQSTDAQFRVHRVLLQSLCTATESQHFRLSFQTLLRAIDGRSRFLCDRCNALVWGSLCCDGRHDACLHDVNVKRIHIGGDACLHCACLRRLRIGGDG